MMREHLRFPAELGPLHEVDGRLVADVRVELVTKVDGEVVDRRTVSTGRRAVALGVAS